MDYSDERDNLEARDEQGKPFVIVHRRLDEVAGGYFRPGASVELTWALRTSGLLRELPPEEVKNLLYLFTFITANGRCSPSIQELGAAMQVSEEKVRTRMERLIHFVWQGHPLVHELQRETGMHAYIPASHIVAEETAESHAPSTPSVIAAASKEDVIAYSRDRYTRPRAEVEREIAMLNGWPLPEELEQAVEHAKANRSEPLTPEDIEKNHVRQRLLRLGVIVEQVDLFLANYELDRIKRQIEWLPYRKAKSPGRYLAAAIEGDYEPPLAVRLRAGNPPEANPAPVPQVVDLSEGIHQEPGEGQIE